MKSSPDHAVHYRLASLSLVLSSVFYSLFSILSVAMIMPVINYIFDFQSFQRAFGEWIPLRKPSPDFLLIMIGAAWFIFLLKNVFYFASVYLAQVLERKRTERLSASLYGGMLNEPMDRFYTGRHAERISRLTTWVQKYAHAHSEGIASLNRALPLLAGYLMILLAISWSLTLLILIAVPLLTWMAHIFSRRIRHAADEERNAWDTLMHVIHQALSSVKLIRLFHSEEHETKIFSQRLKELNSSVLRKARLSGYSVTTLEMTGVTFGLFLLFMTGYGIWTGDFRFGPGGLVLFIASVFSMIDPAKWAVKSFQDFKEAASIMRQLKCDKYPADLPRNRFRIQEFRHEIRWHDVSYRYPENKDYVFRNANLAIATSDRILLTGESGIGKSTFIDLTTGLLTPESGRITIDGTDVTEIHPDDISKLFGVLTQEPFLFNESVRGNLNYPSADHPDHGLRTALKKVQLDEWEIALPNRLETIIGERGATLSGGEKQRLTLARLLLRDPQIIILDEATSGLDVNMESEIIKMILSLFPGRTIIMISHRPSLESFAIRQIRIENQTFII